MAEERQDSPSTPPKSPLTFARYEEPAVPYLILQVLGANGLKPRSDQAVYATVKFGAMEARTRILVGSNASVSWREKFIFPVMPSEPKGPLPDKVVIAVFQVQRGFADDCLGKVQVSIVDIERMKATPNLVQSFLLDVKQTRDTIAAEVIHFTSRKDYTLSDFSKAAGAKLAAKFKPIGMRRMKTSLEDDAVFEAATAARPKEEEPRREESEAAPLGAEVFKEVGQDGCVKGGIEIQFQASMLEEVEVAQQCIGTLKVEVLRASNLLHTSSTPNPYVVLQYSPEWVRLKTQRGTSDPVFGETVSFPVRELSQLLRVGVFYDKQVENGFLKGNDVFLGKVRIRPSTMDVGRRYECDFPLLRPGHKKGYVTNGTLHLAVTLESSLSTWKLFERVLSPPLPASYYGSSETIEMVNSAQRVRLENVMNILAGQTPPIRREVAAQTIDEAEPPFDLQRAKVNIARFVAMKHWIDRKVDAWDWMCEWENPAVALACNVGWVFFVYHEQCIAPCLLLLLLGVTAEHYLKRKAGELPVPQSPDCGLSSKSCSDPCEEPHKGNKDKDSKEEAERKKSSEREETWEDFVLNPLTRWESQLDEALAIVSAVQNAVGNIASFAERVANLVTWVDPRASSLFVLACFALTVVLAVLPIRLVLALAGVFAMRPPQFRHPEPPPPVNLFLRLPTRLDQVYDWINLSAMKKGPQKGSRDPKAGKGGEETPREPRERELDKERVHRTP